MSYSAATSGGSEILNTEQSAQTTQLDLNKTQTFSFVNNPNGGPEPPKRRPGASKIDARGIVLVAWAGSEGPWGHLGRTLGVQGRILGGFWRYKSDKKTCFFAHRFFMKTHAFLRIVLAPS